MTTHQPIDPIIEEIHAVRRAIAERFDYDVQKISADAQRRQSQSNTMTWQPQPSNRAVQTIDDGVDSNSQESSK